MRLFQFCHKPVSIVLAFLLAFSPTMGYAQSAFVATLPQPGVMVGPSAVFVPVLIKGLVVHPDKPLNFDFIVDSGNDAADQATIKSQSERMAKYFLAAVTVPEDQLWVNLSPFEKDRIIENDLGNTILGRDMLAQDYVLKQLTASLIYPEKGLGKEFWARIYKEAREKFGTTDIPVDTFNKVWIMPDKAEVVEKGNAVYVTQARLKVMLNTDCLAVGAISPSGSKSQASGLSKSIFRDIVLPAIEKEVNEGANFAVIRQVYHAAILAKWYRELIRNTLLADAYAGKNKVAGVTSDEKAMKEEIYQRYIAGFQKGAFSYIKEEADLATGGAVPRKYFSGGENFNNIPLARTGTADAAERTVGQAFKVDLAMRVPSDSAENILKLIEDVKRTDSRAAGVLAERLELRDLNDVDALRYLKEDAQWFKDHPPVSGEYQEALERKVSFIVLHYGNSPNTTIRFLNSLVHQTYQNFNVVLVDNNSPDRFSERWEEIKARIKDPRICDKVELISNKINLGFDGGVNQAVHKAMALGSDYVFTINNDAVLSSDALQKMMAVFSRRKDVGAIQPMFVATEESQKGDLDLLSAEGTTPDSLKSKEGSQRLNYEANHKETLDGAVRDGNEPALYTRAPALVGVAILMRSVAFRMSGGFDSRIFMYKDEDDASYLLRKTGYAQVVDAEKGVTVFHEKYNYVNKPRQQYLLWKNPFLLAEKYGARAGKDPMFHYPDRYRVIGTDPEDRGSLFQRIDTIINTPPLPLDKELMFINIFKGMNDGLQGFFEPTREGEAVDENSLIDQYAGEVKGFKTSLEILKYLLEEQSPFTSRLKIFALEKAHQESGLADVRLLSPKEKAAFMGALRDSFVWWKAWVESDARDAERVKLIRGAFRGRIMELSGGMGRAQVYEDAVVDPELKGADRGTQAHLVDAGRTTRLKVSSWDKRTSEPFTRKEQDKFKDPQFESDDLKEMKKEDVKNIRQTIYNRFSGSVVIELIITDTKDKKYYCRLSGPTTTSVNVLRELIPSLADMKAPDALIQVSAGNQGDLPGNFTLTSLANRWKLFSAVDEPFDRPYRVAVQYKDGRLELKRIQVVRSAGVVKVYVVEGERYAPLSDKELSAEGTDFILAAMPLLWDGMTGKELLRENYVNTSDLRHVFRLPNGIVFYDQVAQDSRKLEKAFNGQRIEIAVKKSSDVDLLDKIGYRRVNDQESIKAPGDYWFSEETMTLSIILLPARYPLNALVIGKNGEKGFVEIKGESRERGADYWAVGDWIRQEVKKEFGWEPQAVFALDNGKDPTLALFEHGKEPEFLAKGRESVNASLSVISNEAISVEQGDLVFKGDQWVPGGDDPERVRFVKLEYGPDSGVEMRLFLNEDHMGQWTIIDRMVNKLKRAVAGGGLESAAWDDFLKARVKLSAAREYQKKELDAEGREVFASTSADNLYANRPVVSFKDGKVFYSMEPDGTYSKKEDDGAISNVETRQYPMLVMWKDGRTTIEEGVTFELQGPLGTKEADMRIKGGSVSDRVRSATFVIPIMRNGDFVRPNESDASIERYDDIKHLISTALFNKEDYPDINVSASGGLYFGIDQLLADKKLLKDAVDRPVTLKLSLPIGKDKFTDRKAQERLADLLTIKFADSKVIAGYTKRTGDEPVKERGDYKIDLENGKIEIFFKENNYPFHIIGTKADGTVVDVAIYALKQQFGATVERAFKLMKQLGVHNAGILDQGNTVRVTRSVMVDGVLQDMHLFLFKGKNYSIDAGGVNLTQELYYTVKKTDHAQSAEAIAPVAASAVGGIDIKDINIVHQDGGAKSWFNDQALRDVLKNGFDGFTPVIMNITPVSGTLPLLGVILSKSGVVTVG